MNKKFMQLRGPFAINEDIFNRLREENPEIDYIKRLGISTENPLVFSDNLIADFDSFPQVTINGYKFYITKNILEFEDVEITSLHFNTAEPETTIIDLIAE